MDDSKECGMPYRNDEILYHLNESRSDHYRHASDKARKIMQTQGVGSLGKGSTGKAAGNRNTSSGREKIRPAKTKKHSKLRDTLGDHYYSCQQLHHWLKIWVVS